MALKRMINVDKICVDQLFQRQSASYSSDNHPQAAGLHFS